MRKIRPFIPTIVAILVIYFLSRSIPQETTREFINQAGAFGPLAFILFSFLTYVVAPLSGIPIMFAGYYAFGNKVVFYGTFAAYLSFFVNFLIARRYGRPLVEKLVGKEDIHKVNAMVKSYGLGTLFFLRVFQGAFHDFVSYAAGLTQMKFSSYIVVSTIAIIPGTFLWYYFSSKVNTPTAFTLMSLVFATIFSAIFILGKILIKKLKKK